jgi:DNA-binding Lrp family transcriptional regulator
MELNNEDRKIIAALEDGLPLVPEPYQVLAERVGTGEGDIRRRIAEMTAEGIFGRFGVIVRHREIGYRVAAMVVWDIPDDEVQEAAAGLAAQQDVHLCYRRPRRLPEWPYNIFTMLHGRSRDDIDRQLAAIAAATGLQDIPRSVLYTRRRFKQRGPRYFFDDSNGGKAAQA